MKDKTMKKLFIILIILLCSWTAYGQGQQWEITDTKSKSNSLQMSLYVNAGLNLSFFYSNDKQINPDFSPMAGVAFGGGVNISFVKGVFRGSDKLSGQMGLLYTQSGFLTENERVKGGYLCIPFLVQYYPIQNLYAELILSPCINVGLSPSEIIEPGLIFKLDDHRANDFKIGFGAGYCLEAIPLGIAVNYCFGTSDFAENLPWRSSQLQICLSYRFEL